MFVNTARIESCFTVDLISAPQYMPYVFFLLVENCVCQMIPFDAYASLGRSLVELACGGSEVLRAEDVEHGIAGASESVDVVKIVDVVGNRLDHLVR